MNDLTSVMGEQPGIQIIDYSQILIAAITANFEPNDVNMDMMRHVALNSIRHNVLKFKKRYPVVVIARDNSVNGYWRRDLAYYYKKHRKIKHQEEKDEGGWDWNNIYTCMNTVFAEIRDNFPYICIDIDKAEADDIIGVLSRHMGPVRDVLVVSSDGDFTQLHQYGIRQWSPMMKKWVKCKHGSPRRDLLMKIIAGDGKDTIANIKSKSDYFLTRETGDRAPNITKKYLAPLLEAKDPKELLSGTELERFIENEKLLDLTLIPDNIEKEILRQFEITPAPRGRIYKYLVKNRMVKLLNNVSEF
ncbi:MAG: hypothetical protein [Caudoviricetes sp.]|nr:MAG: hypothetical protein [Caudoviricetes sp.]